MYVLLFNNIFSNIYNENRGIFIVSNVLSFVTGNIVARKEANPSLIYNSTRNYKLDDDTGTSGWKKVDRYDCAGHLAEFLYK